MSCRIERHYALPELTVRVCWDTDAVAQASRRALSYHGFAPVDDAPDPDWHVIIHAEEPAPTVPAAAREMARHASGLRILQHDALLYLQYDQATARIDPNEGQMKAGVLAPSAFEEGQLPAVLYLLLTFGLLIHAQHRDLYAVHAAALGREAPEGVLLVAASDSGKSTMAMNLIREGWHYLTDDSVLLRRGAESVEALPLRRDFALDADAATLFPEIEAHSRVLPTDRHKWRVDVEALYPDQRLTQCTPRMLVFPELIDRSTSQLVPLDTKEALLRLVQQTSFLAPDEERAADHLGMLKQLVYQAPAYHLRAGRDVKRDGAKVAKLLAHGT